VSTNINIDNLLLTKDAAIRNDVCIGESLCIGSNLVVGKNIVNNGDIFTNDINAKNIIFINGFIEDIPINKDSISYIQNLRSDVQLQIDNTTIYINHEIEALNSTITSTDNARKLYVDDRISDVLDSTKQHSQLKIGDKTLTHALLGYLTPVTSNIQQQFTDTDTAIETVNTNITTTDNARKTYVDNQIGDILDATKAHSLIKIGDKSLTEELLGYLTPVTSNIQEQFTDTDTAIETVNTNVTTYVNDEIDKIESTENVFTKNQTIKESQLIFDKTTTGLRFEVYENFHGDEALYSNNATKLNISGYSDNFDNLNTSTNE
jgi:hypothetical protein